MPETPMLTSSNLQFSYKQHSRICTRVGRELSRDQGILGDNRSEFRCLPELVGSGGSEFILGHQGDNLGRCSHHRLLDSCFIIASGCQSQFGLDAVYAEETEVRFDECNLGQDMCAQSHLASFIETASEKDDFDMRVLGCFSRYPWAIGDNCHRKVSRQLSGKFEIRGTTVHNHEMAG
nr:hypothetical protein [Brucella sp.]